MIWLARSYTSITEFYNSYIFDFVQCFVGVYIHKFVDKSVCISDLGIMKHSSASCELFQEAEGKYMYSLDDKNLLSLSRLLYAYNRLM